MKCIRPLLLLLTCLAGAAQAELRLNDIQVLGSHNSYKQFIDPALLAAIAAESERQARALEYHHIPIPDQLRLGLRSVELDVFHDPTGGVFASPAGLAQLEAAGAPYRAFDPAPLRAPGLKVLHIQDIDFRSNCATFRRCLEQMKAWSRANRGHAPVIVTMNAKDEFIDRPEFVVPLPFDKQAFDAWDEEIRAVFDERQLITPDMVRGKFTTLREAVLAGRWPSLRRTRGRFLFMLDQGPDKYGPYLEDHPSLTGRVMFVNAPADRAEAAFLILNDPIAQQDEIRGRVTEGFLVRTRADANTTEARTGDTTRRDAAFASGAQVISTDYYLENPYFGTGYRVSPPAGGVACNPVRQADGCRLPF